MIMRKNDKSWLDQIQSKGRTFQKEVPEDLFSDIMRNMPLEPGLGRPTDASQVAHHKGGRSLGGWFWATASVAAIIVSFLIIEIFVGPTINIPEHLAGNLVTQPNLTGDIIERVTPVGDAPLLSDVVSDMVSDMVSEEFVRPKPVDNKVCVETVCYDLDKEDTHVDENCESDSYSDAFMDSNIDSNIDSNSDSNTGFDKNTDTDPEEFHLKDDYQELTQIDFDATQTEFDAKNSRQSHKSKVYATTYYAGIMSSSNVSSQSMHFRSYNLIGETPDDFLLTQESTNVDNQMTAESHHKMPVKVGVGLGIRLSSKWYILTGLNYSFLDSSFEAKLESMTSRTDQHLHYLGIPLGVQYKILQNRFLDFYVNGGMETEKLIYGKSRITTTSLDSDVTKLTNRVYDKKFNYSVGASVGLAVKFGRTFSIYAEPGISYHFKNGSELTTVYTERPLDFSLNVGFRFNL